MAQKSDYTKASDMLIEIQKLSAQATLDFHMGHTETALTKLGKVKKLTAEAVAFIAGHKKERAKTTKEFLKTIRKTTKKKSHGRSGTGTKTSRKKKS
jgi:hypothetical protein